MGKYVDNHIVTAGYLRRFTDARGLIQAVRPEQGPEHVIDPRKPETVGYRPRFLGPPSVARAAERKLSIYESRGLAALSRLDANWPLDRTDAVFRDRLDIACLVAIHMVRNPAWQSFIAELQQPRVDGRDPADFSSPAALDDFLRAVTSTAYSVDYMLESIPKMASMLASMNWTLVEFDVPLLATSDQPVTLIPLLPDGMQAPVQATPTVGYMLSEEFRFPIDPQRALVFTWANEPDCPDPMPGFDDLAADLNRAVIDQADREWFYCPDRRPTTLPLSGVRTEQCAPVGRLLVPGYGPEAMLSSIRREHAVACLGKMIDGEVTDKFHVARVGIEWGPDDVRL